MRNNILSKEQMKKVIGGGIPQDSISEESHGCSTTYNGGTSVLAYTCIGDMNQCLDACISTWGDSCQGCN